MGRRLPPETKGSTGKNRHPAQTPVDTDREDSFRLSPRKPRFLRDVQTAAAFVAIMRAAKRTASRARSTTPQSVTRKSWQRCIVKIRYWRSTTKQRWLAHAAYISRPGATGKDRSEAGFDETTDAVDVKERVGEWWEAGDPRIFRVMLSPERPDADLEKLTRGVMTDADKELGRKLEWTAVIHDKQKKRDGHPRDPHVHMVIRGIANGGPLLLPREFVAYRMRHLAQDHLTRQLGHREIQTAPARHYGLREI
jgi:hypothetical protein